MLVTTSIGAIRKLVSELHGDTLHTMMVFRDKVGSHNSLPFDLAVWLASCLLT